MSQVLEEPKMNLSPGAWPTATITDTVESVKTITRVVDDPDLEFYIKVGKHKFLVHRVEDPDLHR